MWVLYFLELVDLALLEFGVHRIVVFRYLNVVDKRSEIFGCPFAYHVDRTPLVGI